MRDQRAYLGTRSRIGALLQLGAVERDTARRDSGKAPRRSPNANPLGRSTAAYVTANSLAVEHPGNLVRPVVEVPKGSEPDARKGARRFDLSLSLSRIRRADADSKVTRYVALGAR